MYNIKDKMYFFDYYFTLKYIFTIHNRFNNNLFNIY